MLKGRWLTAALKDSGLAGMEQIQVGHSTGQLQGGNECLLCSVVVCSCRNVTEWQYLENAGIQFNVTRNRHSN